MLFVVLSGQGIMKDPLVGLFYAEPFDSPPADGRTLSGSRVPGLQLKRSFCTEGRKLYALLAGNTSKKARVLLSEDLKHWQVLFDSELPAQAVSIGVLEEKCFLGLANGGVGVLEE